MNAGPRRTRGIEGHDAAGGPEALWQMRRALGRQLAALRNRAGLSQWEFAPLTGYSRSTLSDAELGRHRLRREFWQRCDGLLRADGHLIGSYDRIETAAVLLRQRARGTAQLTREARAATLLRPVQPGTRVMVETCPHCRGPITVVIASRPPSPR